MKHPRPMWFAFAVAAVAVFAAMGWISVTVLRLDSAEAESRRRAQLEENVRLALWRMDSALAPLIAAEHARPAAAYRVVRAPGGPGKGKGKGNEKPAHHDDDEAASEWYAADAITPPMLPGEPTPFVRLYFQFNPEGQLTSPQAPGADVTAAALRQAIARMGEIAPLDALLAVLPESAAGPDAIALSLNDAFDEQQLQGSGQQSAEPPLEPNGNPNASNAQGGEQRKQQEVQTQQQAVAINRQARSQVDRNRDELRARVGNTSRQVLVQNTYNGMNFRQFGGGGDAPAPAGVMHPIWRGQDLLLARRVPTPDGEFVQGCWIDWPAARAWLLKGAADLLPAASLEPIENPTAVPDARLLASVPARLIPGEPPADGAAQSSPIRLSLAVAWACVLLATLAIGVMLHGVVSLSERRGAFVSAVTHELRTPLTTLRMYTEMLEGDMIADESQRRQYLGTLRAEADRLGHLVENVLAYSRLERSRANGEIVSLQLGDVLPRVADRLADRARQAGMRLDVTVLPEASEVTVRINPMSLEQILFNLVDNACKYAGAANDATIYLDVESVAGVVTVRVRDRGPGIAATHAGKLFEPFSKSAQEAAQSAPGLGLGLALSRRLARAMGGDLRLERSDASGACFALTVPTT